MSSVALMQVMVATASQSTGYIPQPGSGSYNTSFPGNFTQQGTPFDPGGAITYESISNVWDGLIRRTYDGQWSYSGGNDNPSLFNGSPIDTQYADTYVSFGEQESTKSYYAMEWKGYVQSPATTYFNVMLQSDDVAMVWIGSAALNPDSNTPLCASYNNSVLNSNSILLTAGLFYPIRVRFQEHQGFELCQLYMSTENGTLLSMNQYFTANNHNSDGY